MLKHFLFAGTIVIAGVLFITSTPAQNQDASDEAAASWRHLALTDKGMNDNELARQINRLGADGWQLVDVENFISAGETEKTVYYFKKPLQGE